MKLKINNNTDKKLSRKNGDLLSARLTQKEKNWPILLQLVP